MSTIFILKTDRIAHLLFFHNFPDQPLLSDLTDPEEAATRRPPAWRFLSLEVPVDQGGKT